VGFADYGGGGVPEGAIGAASGGTEGGSSGLEMKAIRFKAGDAPPRDGGDLAGCDGHVAGEEKIEALSSIKWRRAGAETVRGPAWGYRTTWWFAMRWRCIPTRTCRGGCCRGTSCLAAMGRCAKRIGDALLRACWRTQGMMKSIEYRVRARLSRLSGGGISPPDRSRADAQAAAFFISRGRALPGAFNTRPLNDGASATRFLVRRGRSSMCAAAHLGVHGHECKKAELSIRRLRGCRWLECATRHSARQPATRSGDPCGEITDHR